MELQTCRQMGMGVGPIPWTAINEYAQAKEIAEVERFEYLIREMDVAYLEHRAEKDKKPGRSGGH